MPATVTVECVCVRKPGLQELIDESAAIARRNAELVRTLRIRLSAGPQAYRITVDRALQCAYKERFG